MFFIHKTVLKILRTNSSGGESIYFMFPSIEMFSLPSDADFVVAEKL